jgi:hypothetical protein
MNGTERLAQAQADLQAAEIVISTERAAQLESDLRAAIEQGRAIDERIKTNGAGLVKARAQAEPLWTQRDAISRARQELDAAFQQNDFPSDEETRAYESKRAALTEEWHKLTEPITALSGLIARAEEEFRQLKFARSRAATSVNDIRLGIRGGLVGSQRV